jgi:phage shock protein PspC (stress-responsive transcriptional regulator)
VGEATQADPRLTRDRERGLIAGVCAGVAARLGIDPLVVRVTFVVLSVATAGLAAIAYLVLWVALPEGAPPAAAEPARRSALGVRRGGWRVAAGAGLLTLSLLLVLRELGLWWSDAVVWPFMLAAAGAALLWRQSRLGPRPAEAPAEVPAPGRPTAARGARTPLTDLYRGGFGVALVVGAALLFLSANDALGQVRDAAFAAIVAVLALALILAPFLWRLGRNLAAERAERIRSQERAELAAHLHDSVLQTLTLMQKRAGDPREVATLARRQERELRSWLFGGGSASDDRTLAAALRRVAAEVEDAHGVAIDVVAVGDRPLDPRGEALIAAAREALTNAAKFAADAGPVAVYCEASAEGAQVFVRDRGPGFNLEAVPRDRRGVRDSIIARMKRNGGDASVRSVPGEGTEIELTIAAETVT